MTGPRGWLARRRRQRNCGHPDAIGSIIDYRKWWTCPDCGKEWIK